MYRVARRPLSKMIALLPAEEPPPTFDELERNLRRACLPVDLRQNASGSRIRGLLLESPRACAFEVEVSPREWLPRALEFTGARGGPFGAALASRFFVSVAIRIARDALVSLHAQVRLLAALAPDAVALIDANAFDVKLGDWMRDIASAKVPPSPASFFSVHSVFGDGPNRRHAWLHTHGLHRMGSIDLDVVGVRRRDASAMTTLINHVAVSFLDQGVPLPNATFHPGDGLPLVWLPWEAALAQVDAPLGGAAQRDSDHAGERGVLLAPAEAPGRLQPPQVYARKIETDPVFYVSPAETERMRRLARERLASFLRLQDRFVKDRRWEFHVKLGIPTEHDGHTCANRPEHLWFDVHEATAKSVDATLMNQPGFVKGLRQGERGIFDLRLLSDWAIESPRGRYTPETVLQLERALANDRAPARALLH